MSTLNARFSNEKSMLENIICKHVMYFTVISFYYIRLHKNIQCNNNNSNTKKKLFAREYEQNKITNSLFVYFFFFFFEYVKSYEFLIND